PPRPTTFGGDRPVDLQVPIGFDDSKTYPLVMVLHGYSANGVIQEAYFGIKNEVDAGNAFVVAPDGLVDSKDHEYWNADAACCDFDHSSVDDVAYLGGLLDEVTAAWPIDPAHVILIGHSNGGFMAYRLACERADIVTEIGVLAGAATSDTCDPSTAVDVLHIHGTADTEVPYDGGTTLESQTMFPGAVASTMRWAGFDSCSTTSTAGATVDFDGSSDGADPRDARDRVTGRGRGRRGARPRACAARGGRQHRRPRDTRGRRGRRRVVARAPQAAVAAREGRGGRHVPRGARRHHEQEHQRIRREQAAVRSGARDREPQDHARSPDEADGHAEPGRRPDPQDRAGDDPGARSDRAARGRPALPAGSRRARDDRGVDHAERGRGHDREGEGLPGRARRDADAVRRRRPQADAVRRRPRHPLAAALDVDRGRRVPEGARRDRH